MTLRQIRIGSSANILQYDDADFDSAMETTEPIKAGAPVDPNDVVRLEDVFLFPVAVADIDNPTELNAIVGALGVLILAYKVVAATVIDEYTIYAYDASGPAVSAPYIMDAAGVGAERWIAIGGKYRISTILNALSAKNPPIDADKVIYRDSTTSDALVTSTWTQIKAFLKTYFDTLYGTLGSAHARLHSIVDVLDHSSAATSGRILKADANGLPINATNTDAAVAAAVAASHSNASDHAQGTDIALGVLGTKDPPLDADKVIYRNSASADVLVTSTWTQIKAFLKTYFDTLYIAVTGRYRYAAALADTGTITLPTITANRPAHGFIHCAHASTGVISESAEFEYGSTGVVQIIRGTANIEANGATVGKISLGAVVSANPVVIKNNLGGGVSVNALITLWYN